MKIYLKDIAAFLQNANLRGNPEEEIITVQQLGEGLSAGELSWCNEKNLAVLSQLKAGSVICAKADSKVQISDSVNLIEVKNPRAAFREVLTKFFAPPARKTEVSPNAVIHSSVKIGKNVFVGNYVTIEEGSVVGDNSVIDHGTRWIRWQVFISHGAGSLAQSVRLSIPR